MSGLSTQQGPKVQPKINAQKAEQGVFDIILRAMDIAIFDQMEADIERTFLHIKKENLQVITVGLPYGGILDFSRIDQIIAEGERTFLEIYNKKENLS